jgi:hypothetical protein
MLKRNRLREEDYWIFPIVFFSVFFAGVVIYAGVYIFRLPALTLASLGYWFIYSKIRRDYSLRKAKIYLLFMLILGIGLGLFSHFLTN